MGFIIYTKLYLLRLLCFRFPGLDDFFHQKITVYHGKSVHYFLFSGLPGGGGRFFFFLFIFFFVFEELYFVFLKSSSGSSLVGFFFFLGGGGGSLFFFFFFFLHLNKCILKSSWSSCLGW